MTWNEQIDERHLKAIRIIDSISDKLMDSGIYLPEPYKRRDRREPGREVKEAFEDKMARVIRKRFKKQEDKLRMHFDLKYMTRQKDEIPEPILDDAETEAALLALFIAMAEHEIELFTATIDIPLASDAFNTVEIARKQVGALIKNIDEGTRKKVNQAVQAFLDTPGQTVGNLMEMLPFDTARSFRIATTEVTNLYAEMQLDAANTLQGMYPDVRVVNTWFTNNDQKVCFICIGLDGVQAGVGEMFQSAGDGQFYSRPGSQPEGPHVNDRCWLSTRTVI